MLGCEGGLFSLKQRNTRARALFAVAADPVAFATCARDPFYDWSCEFHHCFLVLTETVHISRGDVDTHANGTSRAGCLSSAWRFAYLLARRPSEHPPALYTKQVSHAAAYRTLKRAAYTRWHSVGAQAAERAHQDYARLF